jgi:hypothetical protein
MASNHRPMLLVGVLLGLACSLSLTKLLLCVFAEISPEPGDKNEVDVWLQENDLQQYQIYFRERGKANVFDLYFLLIVHSKRHAHWSISHSLALTMESG